MQRSTIRSSTYEILTWSLIEKELLSLFFLFCGYGRDTSVKKLLPPHALLMSFGCYGHTARNDYVEVDALI
jgi:hypothetical protein